jgi:hypothetical protein
MSRLSTITENVKLIGAILGIAAVVLAGIQYFFHFPIFYNATPLLHADYNTTIVPLLEKAEDSTPEIRAAIAKNDNAAFEAATRDFVTNNNLEGQLANGIPVAEEIINCHKSYICLYEDYPEKELRLFWYDYRPAIEQMRRSRPASFGATLQAEAARILKSQRESGDLPKP